MTVNTCFNVRFCPDNVMDCAVPLPYTENVKANKKITNILMTLFICAGSRRSVKRKEAKVGAINAKQALLQLHVAVFFILLTIVLVV
jgi:hypothetical protein